MAAALIVAFVPSAVAAPGPSLGVMRAKLADALEDEVRANRLLLRSPPRTGTARLLLERSLGTLRELRGPAGSPPGNSHAANRIDHAIANDIRALAGISSGRRYDAFYGLSRAFDFKRAALGFLQTPRPAAPQCADGRDNDGDGTVDAAFDSGCASSKDGTERSPLAFRFEVTRDGLVATIEGATSGPISRLQITVPSGSVLDTTQPPQVGFSLGCRYLSARQLDCLMKDGRANPRHRVFARLRFREGFASSFRVRVSDVAGRARTQTLTPPAALAADLHVEARIDSAFLGSNGVGRVGGTVVVTSLGPAESTPFKLVVSSNRIDSARAAEFVFLDCMQTPTGVTCPGLSVNRGIELAFAWGMPVSGAGLLTVRFEMQSDTTDPQPANNVAEVSVDLKPSP
ncbi:MAG: hypothetical protein WD067_01565 [Gaiellaceae bacterium]